MSTSSDKVGKTPMKTPMKQSKRSTIPLPLVRRFLAKVPYRPKNKCWPWAGRKNEKGYGLLGKRRAHRLSFEIFFRPLEGPHEIILHRCDTPGCASPYCISAGTNEANRLDMLAKRRHVNQQKTHCPANHEYTKANTIEEVDKNGTVRRKCRACRNFKRNERRRRRRVSNGPQI